MSGLSRIVEARRAALFVLAGLASGCSPVIDTTRLSGPYPPTPPDAEVLAFSTRLPECPFVEVALLAGFEQGLGSLRGTLEALEDRTRRLGGDAIVHLTRVERGGTTRQSGFTGTAVRFTDPGCRR